MSSLNDQIYVTNEQLIRLVAISADALCGMQIRSSADMDTDLIVDSVDYDQNSRHYIVKRDGSYEDVT